MGESHGLREQGGEWGGMNGTPGMLLKQGIVGLLKCVKIFGCSPEQMAACRSHTIYSPLCRTTTTAFVSHHHFAAKVHGPKKKKNFLNDTTKTDTLVHIFREEQSQPLSPSVSPPQCPFLTS